MSELRILVVDDHPLIRHGLRALLEARRGWRICGEADNGQTALRKIRRLKPDIVVLDLGLPDMSGLEVMRKIFEIRPEAVILALSDDEASAVARAIFTSGARGLVLKSDGLRHVTHGVQALARRKGYLSPRASGFIRLRSGRGAESVDLTALTAREQQVFKLLAEGRVNREVASGLDISVRTVEAHRASLMRKLNLRSLGDLIYFAIHKRIVKI